MRKSRNLGACSGNSSPGNRLPGFPGGISELESHFERHRVPPAGRKFVLEVLQGDPARRVGGSGGNVCVRFASRKMRCLVQAESRTVELAFVEYCEHDPEVRFFLCQPGELYVYITDSRGRRRRVRHIPDYLILDDKGFFLVECKPLEKLRRDVAKPNPRFTKDVSGWRWPAAEVAASELGIGYRVFSSEQVNDIWLRNIRFLQDYVDIASPNSVLGQAVVDRLSEAGSMRVQEVLALPDIETQVLWWAIANGEVCADLQHERVFEVDTSWVHSSTSRMLAARYQRRLSDVAQMSPAGLCSVRVEPGCSLVWDGQPWSVVNRGTEAVTLRHESRNGRIVAIPYGDFEELLRAGAIRGDESQGVDFIAQQREAQVRHASDKDLADASRRYRFLEEAEHNGTVPAGVSARSIYRYRRRVREGEEQYGSRFAGLIRRRGRPSGTNALGKDQQQALDEVVETYAKDVRAGRVMAAYARLVDLCEERGIDPPPSRETLRRALKRCSLAKLARRREGARAAYQLSGPVPKQGNTSRVEADRVFQIVHIDHTQLDVELVSRQTGAHLGRPWLTLMVDVRSRMILAWSLSFDPPSRVSLSSVLFDCGVRHRRLPDNLVVDRGSEFNCKDFEIALLWLGIHKIQRPPHRPRFGSVVERLFGMTNTALVHELLGNTRLARRGRTVSSTHHPRRHATWTLPLLHEVCEEWFFRVYPDLVHGTLGVPPRQVFDHDLGFSGERLARYVKPDEALRVLLAPRPEGETRKVDPVRGTTISHLRYWHKKFEAGDIAGTNVPVKIDPGDCGVAFARVRGEWVTCVLDDGDADLSGRSWKQIDLAVKEIRGQRRAGARARPVNARILGRFLRQTDLQGMLARQIERDAEARPISLSRPLSVESPQPFLTKSGTSDSPPDVVEDHDMFLSSTPLQLAPDDDDALEEVE